MSKSGDSLTSKLECFFLRFSSFECWYKSNKLNICEFNAQFKIMLNIKFRKLMLKLGFDQIITLTKFGTSVLALSRFLR